VGGESNRLGIKKRKQFLQRKEKKPTIPTDRGTPRKKTQGCRALPELGKRPPSSSRAAKKGREKQSADRRHSGNKKKGGGGGLSIEKKGLGSLRTQLVLGGPSEPRGNAKKWSEEEASSADYHSRIGNDEKGPQKPAKRGKGTSFAVEKQKRSIREGGTNLMSGGLT